MHRNLSASRRPPRSAARRRRRGSSSRGGSSSQTICTAPKSMLLACVAVLLVLISYNSKLSPPPVVDNGGRGGGGGDGARKNLDVRAGSGVAVGSSVWKDRPVFGDGWSTPGNGTTVVLDDRERWKHEAGWGDVATTDLEEWAPLGPDPEGCLPRTKATASSQPTVLVGWGFGTQLLTLYTYRALESVLHVYPEAHVRVITVGPRFAFSYKWANIIALTQFQKYSKRGYDVKVEIYSGKMVAGIRVGGQLIPEHKWWQRHADTLLYGQGMPFTQFQATKDAVPDAYVTIFLALLELYKSGGIYVDLTTFFVRPLPADLDGFVAGGEGPGGASGGGWGDCSLRTTRELRQRPLVMQFRSPRHPVVACVLEAYDLEVSTLNECIMLSKGNGYGGIDCVLETLEACTLKTGLSNDLRDARVVEWHGCNDETARGYASPSSDGLSGAATLEAIAGIPQSFPPPPLPQLDPGASTPTESLRPPGVTGFSSGAGRTGGAASSTDASKQRSNITSASELGNREDLFLPSSDDEGDGDDQGEESGGGKIESRSSTRSGIEKNLLPSSTLDDDDQPKAEGKSSSGGNSEERREEGDETASETALSKEEASVAEGGGGVPTLELAASATDYGANVNTAGGRGEPGAEELDTGVEEGGEGGAEGEGVLTTKFAASATDNGSEPNMAGGEEGQGDAEQNTPAIQGEEEEGREREGEEWGVGGVGGIPTAELAASATDFGADPNATGGEEGQGDAEHNTPAIQGEIEEGREREGEEWGVGGVGGIPSAKLAASATDFGADPNAAGGEEGQGDAELGIAVVEGGEGVSAATLAASATDLEADPNTAGGDGGQGIAEVDTGTAAGGHGEEEGGGEGILTTHVAASATDLEADPKTSGGDRGQGDTGMPSIPEAEPQPLAESQQEDFVGVSAAESGEGGDAEEGSEGDVGGENGGWGERGGGGDGVDKRSDDDEEGGSEGEDGRPGKGATNDYVGVSIVDADGEAAAGGETDGRDAGVKPEEEVGEGDGGPNYDNAEETAETGEAEEEEVAGSRASASGSPDAEGQERTRRIRRRLTSAGDGEMGASRIEREEGTTAHVVELDGVATRSSSATIRNSNDGHAHAGSDVAPRVSRALGGESGAAADAESVSLLWIGSPGSNGLWAEPEEGSLWAEAFSRLRLTKWEPQQVSAACRIPCGHWDTLSPKGSTASEEAKAQASFQCAPSVFVPGTQKGASTFLFHAISWHPQVVQPLRGAHGFKETGRYSPGVAAGPQKLGLRLAAFPFVEEHENFASGDGSVIYMVQNMQIPEDIRADNPNAKIVFALRDPVARAWSDFRFMWSFYQNSGGFATVIENSVAKTRECFEGHLDEDPRPFDFGDGGAEQLTVSQGDDEAIRHFYSACSTAKDPGQLVRKGIYYYQVLHWFRVFGRDNVMVVDSADLKSRQKETVEEVYRFLGLCPVDVSKLEPENVTQSHKIPAGMQITEDSFKALQAFYEPFNKKLYKLLGRDLGWEKNTFQARR